MSLDLASESPRSGKLKKGSETSDRLWPWYLATAFYLSGCVVVLYDRSSEFGEFFTPADGAPGRLRLNEIGDIAAGIFAPLAFLWLFVATQLQRRELRLQRQELSDTRSVLDEQRRELERAAKESNAQTKIMRDTLESSMTTDRYNYFSLALYYFCRNAATAGVKYISYSVKASAGHLDIPRWSNYEIPISPDIKRESLSPSDNSGVDEYLDAFFSQLCSTTSDIVTSNEIVIRSAQSNQDALIFIKLSVSDISAILKEGENMNSDLVNLRLKSLRLDMIANLLLELEDHIVKNGREMK